MLNLFQKTNVLVLIDSASAYAFQKSFEDNDIDPDIDRDIDGSMTLQLQFSETLDERPLKDQLGQSIQE